MHLPMHLKITLSLTDDSLITKFPWTVAISLTKNININISDTISTTYIVLYALLKIAPTLHTVKQTVN